MRELARALLRAGSVGHLSAVRIKGWKKPKRKGSLEVRPITSGTLDFDLAFWQTQGPEAIFEAAWEMVVTAHEMKGGNADGLRLQRPHLTVREAPG